MKFCFVILHYLEKTVTDTLECIDSIVNKFENFDYNIVIVDNGSNDQSVEMLTKVLLNKKRITVIVNKNNGGFARGNNYGAKFAIDKYDPDMLICLNNDTLIGSSDFLNIIEKSYETDNFDVLGPYIYDKNSKPQNPIQYSIPLNIEQVNTKISKINKLLYFETSKKNSIRIVSFGEKIFRTGIHFLMKILRIKIKYTYDPNVKQINVPLHGAALVFSRKYLEKNKYIFYPKTFLFVEEEILFYNCKKNNYTIVYEPEAKVYHKEDSSTNSLISGKKNKRIFIYNEHLKSYNAFKELIKNGEIL